MQRTTPRLSEAEKIKPISHAEHSAAFDARVATVKEVEAEELREAARIKVRAEAAAKKALAAIKSEQAAETLKRAEGAVRFALGIIDPPVDHYVVHRNATLASGVAGAFRVAEENTLHVVNRPLGREIGIAMATTFLARVPEALPRLAALGVWESQPMLVAIENANRALRQEHNLAGHLETLVALESVIGTVATEFGYQSTSAEDAPRAWAIISACLPGDEEAKQLKVLADEQRARNVAEAEERVEFVRKVRAGDVEARNEASRKGILVALLTSVSESVFGRVGRDG